MPASPTSTYAWPGRSPHAPPSPSTSRSAPHATRCGGWSTRRSRSGGAWRGSETGQALTSILLGLKALDEKVDGDPAHAAVGELRDLVVDTLQDVRRLAVELRPKVLDDFGLVPALERLTESLGEQTGIAVSFEASIARNERLPPDVETALYRIVQESLTNVVKHAGAKSVSIVLARKPSAVAAIVEDDGRGFDPEYRRENGFGIEGMRERVGLLDGRLQIESGESGTTVVAEVPLA
jgi:signal transduction histidine kinase